MLRTAQPGPSRPSRCRDEEKLQMSAEAGLASRRLAGEQGTATSRVLLIAGAAVAAVAAVAYRTALATHPVNALLKGSKSKRKAPRHPVGKTNPKTRANDKRRINKTKQTG
jgi:anti-sigma-K factor RskA